MEIMRNIPYILNGELYEIQYQNGENVTVRCCNCPDRVYRGSVRSTGNFHMHIKRRHPDLLPRLLEMKVNALLERRDRHMNNRSRRSSRRNVRNIKLEQDLEQEHEQESASQVESAVHKNAVMSVQEAIEPPPITMMHTHKLKIKTAFQRHKLQQQEAAALLKNSDEEENESNEPIDYSFREFDSEGTNTNQKRTFYKENTKSVSNRLNTPSKQQSSLNRDIVMEHVISTPFMPCVDVFNNNAFNRSFITTTIVKNEHFFEQAIDLSTTSTNGSITPTSPLSASNGSNASTFLSGREIQRRTELCTMSNCQNFKWSELLIHVESSLRDLQREIRTRNQIDIAKFKFLYPGFNFHC